MVETNEKFKHSSPCSSNILASRRRSTRIRKDTSIRCEKKDVPGKLTEEDMVKTKEKFEHNSPCSSNSLSSCPSQKTRDKGGPSLPRKKMGSFVFDDHLEEIRRGLTDDKKSSFSLMDSMFYLCYNDRHGHFFDLIRSKDIFSKKYVLIPIVCWNHWRLVIFCNFGLSTFVRTETRCILLLDSMGMGALDIEPELRKFVFDIFKAEGRPETKNVIYQIPILVPEVPQQRNDVDCGRFVLYFIKKFIDDAPENFSHINGYPYFMTREWFTSDNFEEFCDKLDRDYSPHSSGATAIIMPRRSQRIRSKKTRQRPPWKTETKSITSRKHSKSKIEILLVD